MRVVQRGAFHWEGLDLIYQKRIVCSLVLHDSIIRHYHLKFEWRDEKTPEFFNIFNARENARLICRKHMEETPTAASLVDLNDKDDVR